MHPLRAHREDVFADLHEIPGSGRPCKVVVLTTFEVDEHVYEALRAGASGLLLENVPADRLVHAIRVATAGEALPAPSVTRRLPAAFTRRTPGEPSTVRPPGLSS